MTILLRLLEIYHCTNWKRKKKQMTPVNMKTEIRKLLNLRNFFAIHSSTNDTISYKLTKTSKIFLKNIYTSWLQSVNSKTSKHMPVFTSAKFAEGKKTNPPFGIIANQIIEHDESTVLEHYIDDCGLENRSKLQLNLIVPQQTSMQYFIQWQRYRKYWWSSITSTPSLFALNEVKYKKETIDSNIVAQFSWGHHTVETISMTSRGLEQNSSYLKCSMSLESAMFILLLDGLMNKKDNEYLKLHRKMAPYTISFALDVKDTINKTNLNELAYLMHLKLKTKDISSRLPDFTLSLEQQIKESLQLGVTYTAILCENTTINGIFHLLNSSTMLKEEVHIADFETYAALICGK